MDKKTVLMVHNYYQIGGGEHTVFENEVAMLRKNGHRVITYTRSNQELKKDRWKLLFVPFSTVWSWKTYREVRRLIRQEHIEVVHCHNTFPLISPSVYYAARSMHVPAVQTIHNFRFLCPNGLFYCDGRICETCNEQWSFRAALKNKCYRGSLIQTLPVVAMLKFHRLIGTYQKISYIFLTEFNKQKFAKLIDVNADNVYIKPNFIADRPAPVEKEREKKFIFAGRLDEYKGIRFVLEAWQTLPEDYYLHIYGDGALRPLVEKAAAAQKNIKFFGFQAREIIAKDISSCMAGLFPSIGYETFGMVIAECFQLGRPVITTAIGNPKAIVEKARAGATFTPDDIVSFQSAVEDVILNNESYAKNARAYFEMQMSESGNYEMLNTCYGKVNER